MSYGSVRSTDRADRNVGICPIVLGAWRVFSNFSCTANLGYSLVLEVEVKNALKSVVIARKHHFKYNRTVEYYIVRIEKKGFLKSAVKHANFLFTKL